MTPFEIIYAIREKLKEYVDDTRYTDRFLLEMVDLTRVTLIRQQYNRVQRSIDQQLEQKVAIPLVGVDLSQDPLQNLEEDNITRSSEPIPKVIELHHRNLLNKVATIGFMDREFSVVSPRRFRYIGHNQFEKDVIYCMMDTDNYLYLKSSNGEDLNLDDVIVEGVFEKPLSLMTENDDNSTFKYPMNSHLVDVAIDMIVQKLANTKPLPSDQSNDSSDDATIREGQISNE